MDEAEDDAGDGVERGVAEEAALAHRLALGDESAFTQIIERYYSPLLSYLTHAVGSREAGEDLLHDLFLRTWRVRRSLPVDGNLRLYLYRAARNALLDHARGVSRAERAMAEYTRDATRAQVSDEAEREELAKMVRSAIDTLPGRAREVFLLHREQGLTYREIAALLGISTNTVKFHLGRAVAAIRTAVGPLLGVALLGRW